MIQPVDESGVIIIGGKPYRGKLEFIKSPRQWGMTVVNHVYYVADYPDGCHLLFFAIPSSEETAEGTEGNVGQLEEGCQGCNGWRLIWHHCIPQ